MTKAAARVGMRIGWGLVGLASAAAIALRAPAVAGAQTVGWMPSPSSVGRQQTLCEPGVSFGWAQLSSQNNLYTVPSDGVIQPTTLTLDPSQPANTTATYPARIPVVAGDVLGVAASCIDWYPSPSPNSSDFPFSASFNPPRPTGNPLGQSSQAFPYQQLVLETLKEGAWTRSRSGLGSGCRSRRRSNPTRMATGSGT
jgi:hypothetical protein